MKLGRISEEVFKIITLKKYYQGTGKYTLFQLKGYKIKNIKV